MQELVKKAVIPVAGLGTRMLPATKAIPKEMLPVVDKPLIQHVVDEVVAAGIREIVLVTHSSKNSIENHFDTSFELEATLERRVKRQLLREVRAICPDDVTVISVRQHEPRGLGDAILTAYPIVGDAPVAVILPDVLIDPFACDLSRDNLAMMVAQFHQRQRSQVLVETVPPELTGLYGIADIGSHSIGPSDSAPIQALVEKPEPETAPSNLAVVGRYVLSKSIWPLLKQQAPGAGGEVQLTDAIAKLLSTESVDAFAMQGRSHDCGSKLGYLLANLEYALRHPALSEPLRQRLNEIAHSPEPSP
ncbi:UTP--glucose-1-phosphate uridylyltransferase GalU [Ferrimonas gelatinilytica]|uniref:UTP--glucose-1-phosphate uridylyltransferase n=1 Tax=Ferrimonas gelatinilytica TaxID=1255257 RepID=A0ABP9RSH7_9GAMM